MTARTAAGRSLEQCLEALEKANRSRSERADAKRRIAAGDARFAADLLRDPPTVLDRMLVSAFLRSIPKIGDEKAQRLLYECRISPRKTLGGLNDEQRVRLYLALRRRGRLP